MVVSGRMFTLATLLVAGFSSAAPNVAIDNVLVSKVDGIATIQIWPGCKMEYVRHLPSSSGLELRIEVRADGECADMLDGVSSERYLPAGRRLGNVDNIAFDIASDGRQYITLNFDEPQSFTVQQHTVGWIEVFVDTAVESSTLSANLPPPLEAPPVATRNSVLIPESSQAPRTSVPRRRTSATTPDESGEEFVVQLGVFSDPQAAIAALASSPSAELAYTTSFDVNGEDWFGLQLGFFSSEASANNVLTDVRATFPDSWVRVATPTEVSAAKASGGLSTMSSSTAAAIRISEARATDDDFIAEQFESGRRAILERRYDDAIADLTVVLSYPDHRYRADARELIGIGYERSGRRDNAIAEYQAFQQEFPDHDAFRRVGNRADSLLVRNDSLPMGTDGMGETGLAAQRQRSDWQLFGGVSQYYWRNQEQLVHDGNYRVSSSGVLALADVSARRNGERFDVLARLNGSYNFNLIDYDDDGDVGWVSRAYVDIQDRQTNLQATLGRQTRRDDGVLGRFDGAGLRYQWRPDLRFSISAGFPVDSPRFVTGGERSFYAASARIDGLWDSVGINVYTHQQSVDGISDRQAIGGEIDYRTDSVNVLGLMDYDASYNVLNIGMLHASWTSERNRRWFGSIRAGAQPYLTTRNALAGQTAVSIDELLQSFSEAQIRTLARDRTAQLTSILIGMATPLSERFDFSFDLSSRQSDATVASGGAALIPNSGSIIAINTSLIVSSLLRQGDLNYLSLRHEQSDRRDATSLIIDTRLPFGDRLRIRPRIAFTRRTLNGSGTEQLIATPSLRAFYRWNRVSLDLEIGGRFSSRELPAGEWDPFTPDGTEETRGAFINAGYRWEF